MSFKKTLLLSGIFSNPYNFNNSLLQYCFRLLLFLGQVEWLCVHVHPSEYVIYVIYS